VGLDSTALLGAFRGRLLIMGSAPCLWDDVLAYEVQAGEHDKMVVNLVGVIYEGVFQHWASCHMDVPVFHRDNIRQSSDMRQGNDIRASVYMHGRGGLVKPDIYSWGISSRGSSGMFAVEVAVALGYDEITLAGIPLDDSGHFYSPRNKWDNFHTPSLHKIWETRKPFWHGKVKSMSGWSRSLLGGPFEVSQ